MKKLHKVLINPANSVLIIVDMQNEFCQLAGRPGYYDKRARILPGVISAIKTLSERLREAGVPIIHIKAEYTLREPQFTVFGKPPCLKKGSWEAEIIEELKPRRGDIVVRKSSYDAFYQTELDSTLQSLVPDPTRCQAIVTGGSLAVCLYHAVLGFYLRNYWTVVPLDCVYYQPGGQRGRFVQQFSYEAYRSVFFSRSDLIEVSSAPLAGRPALEPGV